MAADGTVPFRSGERISFGYLVSQKFVGDSATLRVLRAGADLSLTVSLGVRGPPPAPPRPGPPTSPPPPPAPP